MTDHGGRMSKTSETILQIIPGDGWSAVYLQGDGTLYVERLVAWALVEVPGDEDDAKPFRTVVGLAADSGLATDAADYHNFIAYAAPGEDMTSDVWQAKVRDHLEAIASVEAYRAALREGPRQ